MDKKEPIIKVDNITKNFRGLKAVSNKQERKTLNN